MKLVSKQTQQAAKAAPPKPAPKPETAKERMQRVWDAAQSQLHSDVRELLSAIIEALPEPSGVAASAQATSRPAVKAPFAQTAKGSFVFGKK
jgi:hypothetical protein